MAIKLVVTQAFGDYAKGEEITDQDTVAEVAESHAAHVVKVAYEPEPGEPAKPPRAPKPAPEPDPPV